MENRRVLRLICTGRLGAKTMREPASCRSCYRFPCDDWEDDDCEPFRSEPTPRNMAAWVARKELRRAQHDHQLAEMRRLGIDPTSYVGPGALARMGIDLLVAQRREKQVSVWDKIRPGSSNGL